MSVVVQFPLHRVVRRVQTENIVTFSAEFAELLRATDGVELDSESAKRLDELSDAFEALAKDMREASTNIQRLLGRSF